MCKRKPTVWINSNITLNFQPRSSINPLEITGRDSLVKQAFVSFGLAAEESPKLGVGQLLVKCGRSFSPQQCIFCLSFAGLTLEMHLRPAV